jgi:hypothetical protein
MVSVSAKKVTKKSHACVPLIVLSYLNLDFTVCSLLTVVTLVLKKKIFSIGQEIRPQVALGPSCPLQPILLDLIL